MGKYLKSLTDGKMYCRYCGMENCICLGDEGKTRLTIIAVWAETDKAKLVQFKMQKLKNGRKIPSGQRIWIPNRNIHTIDSVLKTIVIDNLFINKVVFSE